MLLALCLVFALTRAEIVERMRAPVVTYADGMVQVFANCPEDMRREFQSPIARFAANTIECAYQGLRERPVKFRSPGIIIHVGDVRTNRVDIYSRVTTNEERIVTRIYVKSPAHADLDRLRLEVMKGFYRAFRHEELSDKAAEKAYRNGNPQLRIDDERRELEEWLNGRGKISDEEALKRMRKIIEPGVASRRDILTFASRLSLRPRYYDELLLDKYRSLTFGELIKVGGDDKELRALAVEKAQELIIFGGGRGEALSRSSLAYAYLLSEFVKGEKSQEELLVILEKADSLLAIALENTKKKPL